MNDEEILKKELIALDQDILYLEECTKREHCGKEYLETIAEALKVVKIIRDNLQDKCQGFPDN